MAVIKRFGILKMALFTGIYGAIIGLLAALLIGIIFSELISSFFSGVGSMGTMSVLGFGSFGWLSLLILPIIYGVVGFIAGLILTPIINLILKIIKGIDLDIEASETPAYPTQPVQQYQMPPRRQY